MSRHIHLYHLPPTQACPPRMPMPELSQGSWQDWYRRSRRGGESSTVRLLRWTLLLDIEYISTPGLGLTHLDPLSSSAASVSLQRKAFGGRRMVPPLPISRLSC